MKQHAFLTSALNVSGYLHPPPCFTAVKVPLYPSE